MRKTNPISSDRSWGDQLWCLSCEVCLKLEFWIVWKVWVFLDVGHHLDSACRNTLGTHGKQSTCIFQTVSAYSMCVKILSSKHSLLVFTCSLKRAYILFLCWILTTLDVFSVANVILLKKNKPKSSSTWTDVHTVQSFVRDCLSPRYKLCGYLFITAHT